MFLNMIWLSLVNIKRRKLFSALLFTMAFLVACSLFLANLTHKLLSLPDTTVFHQFFYTVLYSVLVASALMLSAVSAVSTNLRRGEYAILRIFGAQRSDIFLLAVFESFFLCLFGAVSGVMLVVLLILTKALYIPYFFEGIRRISLYRLIGIGGQAVLLSVLIEVVVSAILLFLILRKDILELERGRF